GFDTYGFRKFFDTHDVGDIFAGFYISDTAAVDGSGPDVPEVTLHAEITAAAELNVVVASAGVGGGIFATINFDLHDPNHDGKLRGGELLDDFWVGMECLFDIEGEMTAKLFAYLKIGLDTPLGFITIFSTEITIADVVIFRFSYNCDQATEPATLQAGGVLQL